VTAANGPSAPSNQPDLQGAVLPNVVAAEGGEVHDQNGGVDTLCADPFPHCRSGNLYARAITWTWTDAKITCNSCLWYKARRGYGTQVRFTIEGKQYRGEVGAPHRGGLVTVGCADREYLVPFGALADDDAPTTPAMDILAATLGTAVDTVDGPLIKCRGGWPRETSERANAVVDPATDRQGWLAALGPHEHATLTSDGRGARTDSWCQCTPVPAIESCVRYERWTTQGRTAHGYLCPTCRHITQTG
jgi:hypothetical protein